MLQVGNTEDVKCLLFKRFSNVQTLLGMVNLVNKTLKAIIRIPFVHVEVIRFDVG